MKVNIISITTLLLLFAFNAPETTSALVPQRAHTLSRYTVNSNQGFSVSAQTTSGLLNGSRHILNIGNSSVYKFLSVPYAEAPIGLLRFQRPVEIKDRSDKMVDVSKFGKTCPQYRHLTRFISPLLNIDSEHQTSEDCLHLNIYVPSSVGSVDKIDNNRLEPNKQLPVIVWIPGEGFDFADARQFDGSYLAHKTQSIVVTIQYRVGVLGFLHAPKLNITGNMGIYDQIMALKWIKKNIVAFGGDSDRITLMGRFSGSMSISAMITAPKQEIIKLNEKLLFNRVAMLSGVAVDGWIIDSHQAERIEELENSALDKGYCNITQVNDKTCLKEIEIEQLLRIAHYGWRLVVDNELIGQISPIDAIKMNQFASELEGVLIGETGMEGTLCLYRHMLDTRNTNYAQIIEDDKLTTDDLYDIIRDDSLTYFRYNSTKSDPIKIALESMIDDSDRLAAGDDQEISLPKTLRDKYLNACSSYMVKSHLNRLKRNIIARNQLLNNMMDSNKRPVEVFHYELKYKPTFSLAPHYIKTAAHGDDVPLIFGLIYNQQKRDINNVDLLMTRKMMSYVGNFVHGNNPLLSQHSSINSKHDSAAKSNENETTSMDETESSSSLNSFSLSAPALIKRSWSSEGQVHYIDINENDYNEINITPTKSQNQTSNHPANYNDNSFFKDLKSYFKGDRSNIQVIIVESPQSNNVADFRAQSIFDLIEQRNQQQVDSLSSEFNHQYERLENTKSQRLLELHRQQILEGSLWIENYRKNSNGLPFNSNLPNSQYLHLQQAQQQQTTFVNESSFLAMLMFSSCIVIFALLSFSLCLCLMIFRNNLIANKNIKHFATNSSSSCNICDDSKGSCIDAVLGENRKVNRGISNVFAKLGNHNNSISHTNQHVQPQCTSTRQPSPASMVLNQPVESGTNQ